MQKKEKRLIINADDLGISEEVNETIRKCFLHQSITGTSIIACGKKFDEACSMMRDIGRAEIGAHLTVTGEFTPCMDDLGHIGTLLQGEGSFPKEYGQLTLKYLTGKIKINVIMREFEAQILKIREAGFQITHLDSHEHIHMLPGIFKITAGLARKYRIPYIRIPNEPLYVIKKSFRTIDLIRYAALKTLSVFGRKHAGLTCNTAFLGHFHSGRITDDILKFLISSVPPGITEIALHPGSAEPTLTLKNTLDSSKIKLVTHKESAEAV